jgi:hypothetical protein
MEDELRRFRLYKAPSGNVVVNVIIEEESVPEVHGDPF